MTFGEAIRELRETTEPKLTQTQLAIRLNMTQRKLSHLERDQAEPNLDDLRRFARYYHVSVDYLLGLTRDERPSSQL